MGRFVEGEDRSQSTLFPQRLDDYLTEDNPVRVIDVFVDTLDLAALGFEGTTPEVTGRPGYHPATLIKIYIYGYLNRVQSSRRLEREAQRNIELMWLTGRLAPDFKTIADFRKNNGAAIRKTCRQFVLLCRRLDLFSQALVAVDGSKFKAVNNRDRNFTRAKVQRRIDQIEESVARYLSELDSSDRQGALVPEARTNRLREKVETLRSEMERMKLLAEAVKAAPDQQISLTDPDSRSMATSGKGTGVVGYNVQSAVDAWTIKCLVLSKTLHVNPIRLRVLFAGPRAERFPWDFERSFVKCVLRRYAPNSGSSSNRRWCKESTVRFPALSACFARES